MGWNPAVWTPDSMLCPGALRAKVFDKSVMGLEMMGGGGGGDDEAGKEMVRMQREQAAKTYEYNTKLYEYEWEGDADDPQGRKWKTYRHGLEDLRIQKENNEESRQYQNATQRQQYDLGVATKIWQEGQETRLYQKSERRHAEQLEFNELEMQDKLDRERQVLDEQFIETAFQNQSLIQDLYEGVGGAGYEKAAQLLGLQGAEGELNYQKQQSLLNLSHEVEGARFDTAGKQLELIDASGRTDYSKVSIATQATEKYQQNQLTKLETELTARGSKTRADFENQILRREIADSKAKAAYDMTNANIKALQSLGSAATTQAGRSQGKAVQMVLAELGRQQAYTVESIVRGDETAKIRMLNNRQKALDDAAKARIQTSKIDLDSLSTLEKAQRDIEEADRGLSITGQKGRLDLSEIRKNVIDLGETTQYSVEEVERNIGQKRSETGLDLSKIDWNVDNLGARFRTNQDVLRATLDSAVQTSAANRRDIVRDRLKADFASDAMRMLDPSLAPRPDIPEPLDIPELKYVDPLAPEKPPRPIHGAMAREVSSSGAQMGFVGKAATGALAGLSAGQLVASTFATSGWALPVGLAVGLGTFLFS